MSRLQDSTLGLQPLGAYNILKLHLYCSTSSFAASRVSSETIHVRGSVTQKKCISLPENVLWSHRGLSMSKRGNAAIFCRLIVNDWYYSNGITNTNQWIQVTTSCDWLYTNKLLPLHATPVCISFPVRLKRAWTFERSLSTENCMAICSVYVLWSYRDRHYNKETLIL